MKLFTIFSLVTCLFFTKVGAIDVDPIGKEIKAGVKKYKLGDFNGSLEHFKKAEKEISSDPRLEFNKGTTYYKMGDYSQALESFEKALGSNDPNLQAKAMYNIGNTYYKLGNKKKAIESYARTLGLDPNFEQAKKNLEIIRKDDKDSSDSSKENENENQTQQNSQSPSHSQSQKQKQGSESSSEQETVPKNLTPQEANRILESYKQDTVKRKKTSSPWNRFEEIFW